MARPGQRSGLFVAAAVGTVIPNAALAIARDVSEGVLGGDLLSKELKLNERLAGEMHDVDMADPYPSRLCDVTFAQSLIEAGELDSSIRVVLDRSCFAVFLWAAA